MIFGKDKLPEKLVPVIRPKNYSSGYSQGIRWRTATHRNTGDPADHCRSEVIEHESVKIDETCLLPGVKQTSK